MSIADLGLRLVLGALLGGLVGWEREAHGRAAGFRTHLIVCVACVLLMVVSRGVQVSEGETLALGVTVDPSRIAAGAITGVGFIGAGVIVRSGLTIYGLTTAACIWMVAAIGLAVGTGMYLAGIAATALTVVALVPLRRVERGLRRDLYRDVVVTARDCPELEERVGALVGAAPVSVMTVDRSMNRSTGEEILTYRVLTRDEGAVRDLYRRLTALDFLATVRVHAQRGE